MCQVALSSDSQKPRHFGVSALAAQRAPSLSLFFFLFLFLSLSLLLSLLLSLFLSLSLALYLSLFLSLSLYIFAPSLYTHGQYVCVWHLSFSLSAYLSLSIYIYIYICYMTVCLCVYIYMYIYICMHIITHIFIWYMILRYSLNAVPYMIMPCHWLLMPDTDAKTADIIYNTSYTYTQICRYIYNMYVCMYIYIYTRVCIYIYIYMYICIYYLCIIYIYIYISTILYSHLAEDTDCPCIGFDHIDAPATPHVVHTYRHVHLCYNIISLSLSLFISLSLYIYIYMYIYIYICYNI